MPRVLGYMVQGLHLTVLRTLHGRPAGHTVCPCSRRAVLWQPVGSQWPSRLGASTRCTFIHGSQRPWSETPQAKELPPCSGAVARRELLLCRVMLARPALTACSQAEHKTCRFGGRITFYVVTSRRGARCVPISIRDSRALNNFAWSC